MNIFGGIRRRDPLVHLSGTYWLLVFLVPWVMPLQTAVFGIAWWTVFSEKRSARAWGIAASMAFILWTLLPLVIPPHFFWKGDLLLLGIGLVGLIAFAWPGPALEIAHQTQKNRGLPGDGTSSLFNNAVQLVMLLVFAGTYHLWMEWLKSNDLSAPDFISGTLMLALIGLLIVFIHESGHTLVGLLLGMKLRAFIVGPFQWRIRDDKWEFHFEPKQILATSGATGVVPTTPDFPRSSQMCMLAAGVLSNTATGIVALCLSLSSVGLTRLRGDLALFGVFSVVLAAMNSVPFRVADTYSDGARIYQLFSKGPSGDFHGVNPERLSPIAERAWKQLESEFPQWTRHLSKCDGEMEFAVPAPSGSAAGHLVAFSNQDQLWVRFSPPNMCYPADSAIEMISLVKKLTADEVVFMVVMKGEDWVETTLAKPQDHLEPMPGHSIRLISWSGTFDRSF